MHSLPVKLLERQTFCMTKSEFKTVGIIAAMQVEADGIKARLENASVETVSGIDFVSGSIGEKNVVVAKCGVGKVFAALCAEAMILKYSPDCIINTGVAGALNEKLHILDSVVADSVVQHDMDTSAIGDPVGMISGINVTYIPADSRVAAVLADSAQTAGANVIRGTVASGDQFVADNEKKEKIRSLFGADACEMEGAAIGHVCYVNNVPFGVVRAISDGGDDDASMDFPTFAAKAAEISSAAVLEFLARI